MKFLLLILLNSLLIQHLVAQTNSRSQDASTFTDTRDGEVYQIKTYTYQTGVGEAISQTWMIENLRYKTMEGSYYHQKIRAEENKIKYGRLYTWEAANKACPDGWHLPDDMEWQSLIQMYTEVDSSFRWGKQVYENFIDGGSSGFDAMLGGYGVPQGHSFSLGKAGSYWTASDSDLEKAIYYHFSDHGNIVRLNVNKTSALSCRCIKD